MIHKEPKNERRRVRHARVRKKVTGWPERPRLSVFRSAQHMYAQVIDDTRGVTLVAASTLDPEIRSQLAGIDKKEAARRVGQLVASRALQKGIKQVVFDRGGYLYHGRVAALAAGAREAGLDF